MCCRGTEGCPGCGGVPHNKACNSRRSVGVRINPRPEPVQRSLAATRSLNPRNTSGKWEALYAHSSLEPPYFAASLPFFRASTPMTSNLEIPAAARELGAKFIAGEDATSSELAKRFQRRVPPVPCARVLESAAVRIRHGRNASWHEGCEALVGAEHHLYPGVFFLEFMEEGDEDSKDHQQVGCFDLFEHAAQGNLQLFKGKR